MSGTYYQQPFQPTTIAPPTMGPYQTKIGGGSRGITIPPVQYQVAKTTNTANAAPAPTMTTPGQGLAQASQNLVGNVKEAMNLYQQRFGANRQPADGPVPGLSSYGPDVAGAGGMGSSGTYTPVTFDNGSLNTLPQSPSGSQSQALATGNQIGPPNPTAGQQAAANADAGNQAQLASTMPSGMNTGGTDVAGQSVGGAGGFSKSALGAGVGSVLGAVSSMFGNLAQNDMKLVTNPIRPNIQPEQANYNFAPFFGGGSLS